MTIIILYKIKPILLQCVQRRFRREINNLNSFCPPRPCRSRSLAVQPETTVRPLATLLLFHHYGLTFYSSVRRPQAPITIAPTSSRFFLCFFFSSFYQRNRVQNFPAAFLSFFESRAHRFSPDAANPPAMAVWTAHGRLAFLTYPIFIYHNFILCVNVSSSRDVRRTFRKTQGTRPVESGEYHVILLSLLGLSQR